MGAIYASSQNAISSPKIETYINDYSLKMYDLWLPWDYHTADRHYLKVYSSFLAIPQNLIDYSTDVSSNLISFSQGKIEPLADSLLGTLEVKRFQLYDLKDLLPGDYINNKLETELNSKANLVTAMLLRQYLSPLYLAEEALNKDLLFYDGRRIEDLIKWIDTLIIYQNMPQTGDIYADYENKLKLYSASEKFFNDASIINYSDIFSIGFSLFKSIEELNEQTKKNFKLYLDSVKTTYIQTEQGLIAIGGKGNDTYIGNFLMIIDIGGNDTYISSTGVNKISNLKSPVRYIIDFDGDDAYIGSDYAFGGAVYGINLLLDLKGNDSYSAGNFCFGSGYFGFGILRDYAGSDLYSGGIGSMGSAGFGIGMLIDDKGSDVYRCRTHSQGYGFTKGFGILADLDGSDSYISSSPYLDSAKYKDHFLSFSQGAASGFENIASGGIGFLFDNSGNDTYISDNYSQGSAYWRSAGILIDASGNDKYQSFSHSQASAELGSAALLFDQSGQDVYNCADYSQSNASGYSLSLLADMSGNDSYIQETKSVKSADPFISIFFDNSGNNNFIPPKLPFDKRNLVMPQDINKFRLALINYNKPEGRTGQTSERQDSTDSADNHGWLIPYGLKPARSMPPSSYDSLYVFYSVRQAGLSESELASFFANKTKSEEIIMDKINSKIPSDMNLNTVLVPELSHRNEPFLLRFAEQALKDNDVFLTKIYSSGIRNESSNEVLKYFEQLSSSKNWYLRLNSVKYYSVNPTKYINEITYFSSDESRLVRAREAYFSAMLFKGDSTQYLFKLLSDSLFVIREAANAGLKSNRNLSFDNVIDLLNADISTEVRISLAASLTNFEYTKKDVKKIRKAVKKISPEVRNTILQNLKDGGNPIFKKELENISKKKGHD